MKSDKIYNLKQNIEFTSCFFCDKTLVPELTFDEIKAYSPSISDKLREYTKLKLYKIGNKCICESCKSEIWAISQN